VSAVGGWDLARCMGPTVACGGDPVKQKWNAVLVAI
jgi:hypothetical protein